MPYSMGLLLENISEYNSFTKALLMSSVCLVLFSVWSYGGEQDK